MNEKILRVFNRKAELLRLVGATFYSKVASLRRVMKKNLIILKSLQKTKLLLMAIFCFICFVVVYEWVVKYQLKVFGTCAHWTYLWQCCIWNFSQYYNNLHFYWAIINWNFIWNILLNNGIYWDLRNKSVSVYSVRYFY